MKTQTRIGLAVALILALTLGLAPRAGAAGYQMPVTFGGYTNRTEALTNFPVLVVFSNGIGSSGFSFSSHPFVTTNGYDLRFYTNATDTNSLDYEIESWNTNSASFVWVRVPLIPTNGSGSIIAKWGDVADSSQLACTTNGAVWTNGFVGVWHFPNGSALSTADSSSNRNDGTVNGTVTATNGTVNGGANFDGASYLERADNTSLSLSQGTISAWVYLRSDGGMQYPQDNNNILTKGSYAYYFTAGDRKANLWHGAWLSGTTQFSLSNWVYVAGTFDGSTRRVFLNGAQDGTGSDTTQSGAGVMRIGRRADGQTGYLNGLLDEVRLENVARSTNWVWACYQNMASNAFFNGYGSVQGGTAASIGLQPVANLTTNSADLVATLSNASADVYVYWDMQDRGTNFTWAYTNSPLNAFANTAAGTTITNIAAGLTPGTSYAYRFYATNTASGLSAWSAAGSFTTLGVPAVDNSTNGASSLGVGTATLNGRVTSTNGAVSYGLLFWGPTDGSNNPTAWAYTNDISGTVTQGVAYAVTLSNLLYGQQYYYRAAASNSYGLGWATNSVAFVTTVPMGPSALSDYVIRYTFEKAGTTTVTNDGSAGATYDGTLVSTATLPTITNGVGRGGGKALSMLTGTSRQAVQIGSNAGGGWGPNGGLYTLSLWFYGMYDASGYRTAFKQDWNTDGAMYITDAADAQNMRVWSGSFKDATTQFSMKPYRQGQAQGASWHMLTFVATNSVTQTYVDGVAAGSTIPWVSGVNIGTVGGNQNQNNRNFAQYLDDVCIYARALTSNEVVSLYQNPETTIVAVGITNTGVSGGTSTSAVLNATLQASNAVFTVSAYYWAAGAGSSNVVAVGTYTNAASTNLSVSVTNLTPGTSYACTFLAQNAATNLWATPAAAFITGDLTVQATDPTGRVTLADTAAFTVYRPSACTNDALTVYYTLNGMATNGTHYTNSPAASGTNGAVTISAGQTNAVITVTPLNVSAPQQTVVLTLASGPYVIGAANAATCTLAAIGATYYTSQSGNWTNSATWGGSGPPSSGEQGVVRHGVWNGAVLATTNLGAAGNYATITVVTNGLVAAKGPDPSESGTVIANPVTFDGGKLGSGHWNAPGGEWTGPITITTNGLIVAPGRNGSPKFSGKVSGPGGITLTTPDVVGSGGLTLSNAANDFIGSVIVTQGTLTLACDHALPTGKVVHVYGDGKVGFDVSQTYASEPPPIVNLYGGSLRMGILDAAHNVTNGLAVNVSAAGGYFNSGRPSWATGRRVTGPIAIASGGTLNVGGSRGGGWVLDGPISGAGALRFYVYDTYAGLPISEIACTSNMHSGGTLVATYGASATHSTVARAEGSLGTGPVTTETNTVMQLDKTVSADWTLTNTLAGAGAFQVEDGSANYRLTAAGTVSPGTNAGAALAVLRIDGKCAFGKSGGTPATLAIDVASAGTTPGVNHDQFSVDHPDATLASSITNCALVVTRVPSPIQMNGLTLTIVSASGADFSSYQFASVTGLGSGGSVVYGNGSITLTWVAATPIINNGAYSNLAATSCDVSGYLSSTGDSPTVVRCYYGTNSAGTSGWGYTNDLGTQAISTVWTSLTGLTSTVKYYYRFYATNDVGEYWSVATSNFTTLGDVYWNDTATGNWNADNANTWGQGTGVYPKEWLNDHVTIDSHTVTLMNSLAAGSTAPADITLATNGTLQAGTDWSTYSVDSPVTINGGTVYGPGLRGLTFNGPVTMQSTSTVNIGYLDRCTFNGPIAGTGRLIAWFRHFNSGVNLANVANTNWTGTLDVNGSDAGTAAVTTNGGLGRATANVYKNLNLFVTQDYGVAPKPTINVYPGGAIWFGVDMVNINRVVVSDIPVAMNGGQWASSSAAYQYYGTFTQSGPVTLNSNAVVGCGDYSIRWTFAGPIDGPGQFILQSPGVSYGAGITTLGGTNTHTGGTWVQSGLLVAKNTNAFGSGAVQVDYNTNAASHGVIQLAAVTPSADYWVLTNSLAGDGTFQVEDGAGTNTLTVLGSVSPGTNTASAGILRVDGDLAMGSGSRLQIGIAGTNGVAGVDYDRLLVDHDLTGLSNAVLEIGGSTNLVKVTLMDQELVVVSNATTLAGEFAAVEWTSPWRGKVKYNDPPGTVKLIGVTSAPSPGTVLLVQ